MQLGSGVAMATDLIRLLAWEAPYSMGVAPKRQKTEKKKKDKEKIMKVAREKNK